VRAPMLTPDEATSFARLCGRPFELDELADRLRRGYEQRLGVRFTERSLGADEAFDEDAWLAARRPRAYLDRHASLTGQLGVLELHFARDGDRIRELCIAGDVIANSAAIARLEHELRGCPAEPGRVAHIVERVLAEPENFLLGLGPVARVAAAIGEALAA